MLENKRLQCSNLSCDQNIFKCYLSFISLTIFYFLLGQVEHSTKKSQSDEATKTMEAAYVSNDFATNQIVEAYVNVTKVARDW